VSDRLIDADEAARILRCTRRYVLRLAREGAIERVKPPGRKTVLFWESAILAYLESGRQAPVRVGSSAARLLEDAPVELAAPRAATWERRRFPLSRGG
jgi:excisionase family DNA binding protein